MKLSTINQIVQGIYDETKSRYKDAPTSVTAMAERRANSAAIVLRTALIYETDGYDAAMDYFFGTHDKDEYVDWLTGVVRMKG